jgi:hypothetical protein
LTEIDDLIRFIHSFECEINDDRVIAIDQIALDTTEKRNLAGDVLTWLRRMIATEQHVAFGKALRSEKE